MTWHAAIDPDIATCHYQKRNCIRSQSKQNSQIEKREMGLLCCFDGGNNAKRKEEDRIASAEALAKAAEAAQRRYI